MRGGRKVKNTCLSYDSFCRDFNRLMWREEWGRFEKHLIVTWNSFYAQKHLLFLVTDIHFFWSTWHGRTYIFSRDAAENCWKKNFFKYCRLSETYSGSDENSDLSQMNIFLTILVKPLQWTKAHFLLKLHKKIFPLNLKMKKIFW